MDSVVSNDAGGGTPAAEFLLIGGRLCIDFANTVYAGDNPGGALSDFRDVVAFAEITGTVGGPEARRLRTRARESPRQSSAAFVTAVALRDMLRAWLPALEAGVPVRREWVDVVNGILRCDLAYPQLVARRGGWSLVSVRSRGSLLATLVPVARSAAELIQEGPGAPVRRCANPRCVLYFYDTSRRATRRWCSMAVCGNRMKVAAHARRHRRARP
jgi:predicted RNA-binding Zn ribbon-like protein